MRIPSQGQKNKHIPKILDKSERVNLDPIQMNPNRLSQQQTFFNNHNVSIFRRKKARHPPHPHGNDYSPTVSNNCTDSNKSLITIRCITIPFYRPWENPSCS
ncbi:hypothetical protein Fot_49995 [Forsythia ovata]|uniref:Uncharacterized protein n=1 Tax=Forsythia ovata TaxID=205694 RepID=A0ABD1PXQ3_9LAMI